MRIGILAGRALTGLALAGLALPALAQAEGRRPPSAHRAAPNLSAYVGKYPFDTVLGYRFLDHPAVRAVIARAVPDARLREQVKTEDDAVNVPIVLVNGRILAWGGAKRAEDRYNWSVVIAPDGSAPEVCIYEGLGYENDQKASQWFEPGKPGIMKQGNCPSSHEDYPARPIAAG